MTNYQSTDSILLILLSHVFTASQIPILKRVFFILSPFSKSYIIWRKTFLGCFFLTDKDTKCLVTSSKEYGHKCSVQSFSNTKYGAVCMWNAALFSGVQPLENAGLNSSNYHSILFAGVLGFAQMMTVQRIRIMQQRNAPLSPLSSGKSHWPTLLSSAEMGRNNKSFLY